MKLNIETGKFWSFKDTKNYKHQRYSLINDNVTRTFIFDKSFLLQVTYSETIVYVVPIKYMGNFPDGFYTGSGTNKNTITFTDSDIIKVL
jgi:hypothetical protein